MPHIKELDGQPRVKPFSYSYLPISRAQFDRHHVVSRRSAPLTLTSKAEPAHNALVVITFHIWERSFIICFAYLQIDQQLHVSGKNDCFLTFLKYQVRESNIRARRSKALERESSSLIMFTRSMQVLEVASSSTFFVFSI